METAREGDITFITDQKYLSRLAGSAASAVMLAPGLDAGGKPALVVPNPQVALISILGRLAPVPPAQAEHVDRSAWVHPKAKLGAGVVVGPLAVIDAEAEVGDATRIGALCYVGWRVKMGAACRIAPLVTLGERTELGSRVIVHSGAVLGADGFGFVPGPEGPVKIPQIGRVVVGDDVEIGANCTVDRGMAGDTVLKRGVKLDDQVHVAHNCVIGEGTLVAAQTGFSGTVTVGKGSLFGGQVGVADHVNIGNGVKVGAQSGIHRDAADGEELFGYPARPAREAIRLSAEVARLPRLLERVRALEKRIAELERKKG